ncbi:MAG: hypothetical protein ACM3N5_10150 [Candidatus Eiseniibacteriota bacterium]
MRSLWIRCLAALVSLALASWTVHAMAHGGATPAEHCRDASRAAPAAGHHDHSGTPADSQCCCDYVACASAAIVTPAVAVATVDFAAVSYRQINASVFSIGAPYLDPDPPRPGAPS